MTKILFSISLFLASVSFSYAVVDGTVYVSPTGLATNAGTDASPKSLDAAFDSDNIGPGTIIILKDGTYNISTERYLWRKIGAEGNPIIIKAQNKHMAILKGVNTYSASQYAVVTIAGCKYLEFDGITVMHEAGSLDQSYGIRMTEARISSTDVLYTEFITVKNCNVYGHGGGGISADGTDNIYIENNIVYGNCTRNKINTSGISVYKMKARSTTTNYWGIIIRGNRCYDNKCELDFYYNENGNIYSSDKPTDGNGIILDVLDDDANPRVPYGKRVLIENNVCYNNGGAGVKIYKSSSARIINNTIYHNNTILSLESPQTGEIVLFGLIGNNGVYNEGIYNNVVVVNPNITTNKVYGIVVDFDLGKVYNNFLVGDNAKITLPAYTYSTSDFPTANTIKPIADQTSPGFISPGILATSNFRLRPTSPLIGGDTQTYGPTLDFDKVSRPQGTYTDLGAYEFVYATGVTLNRTTGSISNTGTLQLTATVAPSNATYKNITWTSSNTAVATVSSAGLVTGVSGGTATITAKTVDGNKTATCAITVSFPSCGLVQNFGFETGNFTNWTFTAGQCDVNTIGVKAGTYAGRVAGTGTITYGTLIPVAGKRNVEFKGWARMDATPSDAYFAIDYLTSNNTVISTDKVTIYLNSATTEYKVTKQSPTNTVKVRLRAFKSGSGNFAIDNMCFTSTAIPARIGVEDSDEPTVSKLAYPNPVSDVLRVPVLDESANEMIVIMYDLTGKAVLNQNFKTTAGQNTVNVNVGHLTSGSYIIVNKQGEKENRQTIVKQ